MLTNTLTLAQQALQRNARSEAARLFRLQVTQSPQVAAGWLGLFQATDQYAERLECLDHLLQIAHTESPVVQKPVSLPVPAPAEPFESIDAEPAYTFVSLKPRKPVAPFVPEVMEALAEEPSDTFESAHAAWTRPWLEDQIVNRTDQLVAAGNRFMHRIDTELIPALRRQNKKSVLRPFSKTRLTQSSTSKLRSAANPPLLRVPKLLNWVLGLVALVLVGAVAVAAGPIFMGNKALVIISGSMVPTIGTGSVVVLRPVEAAQLQVGDIIAYSPTAGSIPLVHRIIKIREEAGTRLFTTQGDANVTPDFKEVVLPPNTWQLWYSVPWLGYIINFSFSRLGFVVFILVPLLGLGGLMLKDRFHKPLKGGLLRANRAL